MAVEEFDLEAAMRNVQSTGRPAKVEQAHVFLPDSMRAEVKRPPLPENWSVLPKAKAGTGPKAEVVPNQNDKEKIVHVYQKRGLKRAVALGGKLGFYEYQVKEIVREYISAHADPNGMTQTEALEYLAAAHGTEPAKVPWFVKQPVWDNLGRQSVQTSAQKGRDVTAEEFEAVVVQPSPAGMRTFGCAVCGNKSVQCKDDGQPYEHKCSHHAWCRTKSGHPECPECEKALVARMEQATLRQSKVQRELAANVKAAEKNTPRVGWDLVEVTRPVKCPICQEFLQGKRAVRVWVYKDGEWIVNNVQCTSHHRPGVPVSEMT